MLNRIIAHMRLRVRAGKRSTALNEFYAAQAEVVRAYERRNKRAIHQALSHVKSARTNLLRLEVV